MALVFLENLDGLDVLEDLEDLDGMVGRELRVESRGGGDLWTFWRILVGFWGVFYGHFCPVFVIFLWICLQICKLVVHLQC